MGRSVPHRERRAPPFEIPLQSQPEVIDWIFLSREFGSEGVPMRTVVLLSATLLLTPLSLRAQQVYRPGPGVSLPIRIKDVKPAYTPEAQAAGIVGWVMLDVVVLPTGAVGDVKVLESCLGRVGAERQPNGDPFRCATANERAKGVDPVNRGLDKQAVNAAKQWVFRPGLRAGHPVAVRMATTLNFRPTS
jgi:hypothetical protein